MVIFSLSLGVVEIEGNWGTFENGCGFGVPCVGVLEIGFSPVVFSPGGNFPSNGGEWDQQRGVAASLRRLVLRRRSASGRRDRRKTPIF